MRGLSARSTAGGVRVGTPKEPLLEIIPNGELGELLSDCSSSPVSVSYEKKTQSFFEEPNGPHKGLGFEEQELETLFLGRP